MSITPMTDSDFKAGARLIVEEWADQWYAQDAGYRERMMRVDANMSYSLQRRIAAALEAAFKAGIKWSDEQERL